MIRVKELAYQGEYVLATVEYDLEDVVYSFIVQAKELLINSMTVEAIKAYIVNRVQSERSSRLRSNIEDLLNPLIGVDLEAVI